MGERGHKRIYLGEPNEKQKLFFKAQTKFVAYGGARGGGKSWSVRVKALLMAVHYAGIRILILRRTYPELWDNHILPMMEMVGSAATYRDKEKAFVFGNGSRVKFGYLASDKDALQYQGQEYDVVFLDEATQFTEFMFSILTACVRGANDFPKRMYLTCNPGGVGHGWVKRLFIDREYKNEERAEDYAFIQATVYDNKAMMDKDPGYVRMLENLPDENLRRAWLEGDWTVFAGQYFTEFRTEIHTCEPFEIPNHWRRYFAMDYGLDMFAGYWFAVDDRGKVYVYREVCRSDLLISEMVETILENTTEPVYAYLAPPDMWNRRQDTGKSIAEIAAEAGIWFERASNDRVSGWLTVKEFLRVQETEEGPAAGLCIFRNCRELIKNLPLMQYDQKNPSDCAKEPHEVTHSPDALRYFIAGRPVPAVRPVPKRVVNFGFERENPSCLGEGEKIVVI